MLLLEVVVFVRGLQEEQILLRKIEHVLSVCWRRWSEHFVRDGCWQWPRHRKSLHHQTSSQLPLRTAGAKYSWSTCLRLEIKSLWSSLPLKWSEFKMKWCQQKHKHLLSPHRLLSGCSQRDIICLLWSASSNPNVARLLFQNFFWAKSEHVWTRGCG